MQESTSSSLSKPFSWEKCLSAKFNKLRFHCPDHSARQPAAAIVNTSLGGVVAASSFNSVSGTVNCEKPQFKQTTSFGNTKTPGLSTFLKPLGWSFASAANSIPLSNAHAGQDINPPTPDRPCRDTTPITSLAGL